MRRDDGLTRRPRRWLEDVQSHARLAVRSRSQPLLTTTMRPIGAIAASQTMKPLSCLCSARVRLAAWLRSLVVGSSRSSIHKRMICIDACSLAWSASSLVSPSLGRSLPAIDVTSAHLLLRSHLCSTIQSYRERNKTHDCSQPEVGAHATSNRRLCTPAIEAA